MSDPIADLLTTIRNGYLARLREVSVPYSRMKESLVKILFSEGFVKGLEVVGDSPPVKRIKIDLKYRGQKPVVTGLKRISKPGARIYSRADKFPRVRFGFGITVISTSKGLMTNKEAKKHNLGGEIICQVW